MEVKAKFRLFQKPANFDQRLKECEQVLEEVKGQLGMLNIYSVEQDVVQSQLEHCMVSVLWSLVKGGVGSRKFMFNLNIRIILKNPARGSIVLQR